MGFFGGDNEDVERPSRSEQLIDEQFRANQAELEIKKRNLYRQRLAIIKGQGGQNWTPDYSSPLPSRSGGGKGNIGKLIAKGFLDMAGLGG